MEFLFKLFKSFIFLFFNIDEIIENDENVESEEISKKEENDSIREDNPFKLTFFKFIILIGGLLGVLGIIYLYSPDNSSINLNQLQSLLEELSLIIDWDLFRDIFLNIQKMILKNDNTTNNLYVLDEIRKFFLNDNSRVKDSMQFDKIMKEIIKLLSKDE